MLKSGIYYIIKMVLFLVFCNFVFAKESLGKDIIYVDNSVYVIADQANKNNIDWSLILTSIIRNLFPMFEIEKDDKIVNLYKSHCIDCSDVEKMLSVHIY